MASTTSAAAAGRAHRTGAAAAGRAENGDESPELPIPPTFGLEFDQESYRRRPRSPTTSSNEPQPGRKKSRKEEMYKGWPDELRTAHSWIRRIIRQVAVYQQPDDPEAAAAPNQMVVDCCHQHPMLATERFLCDQNRVELTPLKFLIHNRASVDVIAGFCEAFPQAVQQSDPKNDFYPLDGYPLHFACTRRQDDGDLIAGLAKAFPKAVSTHNERGFLPLHLLLEYRGVPPASKGIQVLMKIYPEAAMQKPTLCSILPPPVYSIMSGHYTLEHMEPIYSQLPQKVVELNFPQECFRNHTFSLDHAKTIARALPQINALNLQPTVWSHEAWRHFVQSFQEASNLRRLAIRPPAMRQGETDVVVNFFEKLLSCGTRLSMLDLQASHTTNRPGAIVPDITESIVHIIKHGRLESLRVMGFPLTARPILEALRNNTLLKHLILHGLVTPTNPKEVIHLSTILEQQNLTLLNAQMVYAPYPLPPLEVARIQHYTRLNRLGRAAVRHATVDQITRMLVATQMDPELQRARPREGLGILYGLLRESPGVWSGGNQSTNRNHVRANAID